jgi:hypothetical protein
MRIDWLGDHEQRGGAMALRGPRLGPRVRVERESLAVERRVGVVLARLVIEDEHRLAAHVHARVVVIAELGGGDAVAGEDDVQCEVEPGGGIRKGDGDRREPGFVAGLPDRHHRSLAIQAQRQEIEGLQVRLTVGGLQTALAELVDEEPRRGIRAGCQAGATLEPRRGQDLQVRTQAFAADLRRRLRPRRRERQQHERRHEASSPHGSAVYCVLPPEVVRGLLR